MYNLSENHYLCGMDESQVLDFYLPNGIRVVYGQTTSAVAHCGMYVHAGSRDEQPDEQGLAHFMEHLLFKGTTHRKAYHIISRIDEVGGELNAFTTKENTFIYASFLSEYMARAFDIIADITFNSTFPEKEIEKERAVIVDEIRSYMDDPTEAINDEFDELIFPNHPLGINILGTEETVQRFTKEDIKRFQRVHYTTDRMVLCYLGPAKATQVKRLAERYFSEYPATTCTQHRTPVLPYAPQTRVIKHDYHNAHLVLGGRSYGIYAPERVGFAVLNNILGGPGLNSRLNLGIREKYGFTYYLESNYTPFEDTGMWSVYLSTDTDHLEKTQQLVLKELGKLRTQALGTVQLHKAKVQIKGQLALSNENYGSLIYSIAKSFACLDKLETLPEIYQRIDALTAFDLQTMAEITFDASQISYLVYKPQ